MDALIAARRTGDRGMVVGVDFSAAMLERAHEALNEAQLHNVVFFRADAEHLPIRSASIDLAMVNGIFNLNTSRTDIFRELARVLRKGGVVYAAELVLREQLAPEVRSAERDWFA